MHVVFSYKNCLFVTLLIFSRCGFPLNRAFWLAGGRSGFPHTDPAIGPLRFLKKYFQNKSSRLFFRKISCHYHTRMDNESIHSKCEFYLYPEEQDKYGLFVFFHCTRDITLSINFPYTAERRLAGFLHELKPVKINVEIFCITIHSL